MEWFLFVLILLVDFRGNIRSKLLTIFSVPDLIVFLNFFQLFFSRQLFSSHSYSYLPLFHRKKSYNLPDDLPHPHFFPPVGYTITIKGNVCNIFEIYSVLLRIHCTFLLNTINISLHVYFCGKLSLYIRIEWLHHISYLNDGCLLCCTCTFIPWI